MKNSFFSKAKLRSILALSTICIFLISSCEKKELMKEDIPDNKPEKVSFFVQDGILMFNSMNSFLETKLQITNFTEPERKQWEESAGFLSQRRIFDIIISEEDKWEDELISKYNSIEEIEAAGLKVHSDAYYNYLEKGIIKVIDKGTDDEYWDYAAISRGFVELVNEQGLVGIGDTIYHVSENALKALTNGNFDDIDKLIKADIGKKYDDIVFLVANTNLKGIFDGPGLIESPWVSSGGGKSGEKRIKIGIFLEVLYYIPQNHHFDFYNELYVQCQERNWLRNWKYKFADINVNGEWIMKVYYNAQFYGNSYSFNGSASYLKSCINPQTGQPAVYRSYFGVNPSNPDDSDRIFPPRWNMYHWSATRPGGCCGLTATLDY